MKSFAATLLTTIALLSIPQHVAACVRWDAQNITVRDHFEVVVLDRGQPVAGFEVVVEYFDKSSDKLVQVANATTDGAGLARFVGVPAGSYVVSTHTPVDNDGQAIQVNNDASKPAEQKINLTWPPYTVIVTNKFSGVLTSIAEREQPTEALEGVRVNVREAYSGRVAGKTVTDADGKFELNGVLPGLYFLELSGEGRESEDERLWGAKLLGDVAIEYNPFKRDAPSSAQVRLMVTDCGLMYKAAK